jgi:beta-glucan synthesis-associated protein KRE6
MPGHWDLVDKDTPESARTRKSLNDENEDLVLVFSDEFNADGRTFYPGTRASLSHAERS